MSLMGYLTSSTAQVLRGSSTDRKRSVRLRAHIRGSFRLYHSMAPSCSSLSKLLQWSLEKAVASAQVKSNSIDSTRISVLNGARDMTIHVATQTLCAAYFKSDLPGVV